MFLMNDYTCFKMKHIPKVELDPNDFIFIYQDGKIALTPQKEIPRLNQLNTSYFADSFYCFGSINQYKCLLWEMTAKQLPDLIFHETKLSYRLLSSEFYHATAIGNHLNHWRDTHRYCGKCAMLMVDKVDERARFCATCNNIIYPKISPCIIVLIIKDEEILLARSSHFLPGVMSLLAGFIEIGESVEQALIREVKEETTIEIKDLKYICSQPWPFPDLLMLGFTAHYASGEIIINNQEIEAANWFKYTNLPPLPNEMSIARYLIDQHFNKLI